MEQPCRLPRRRYHDEVPSKRTPSVSNVASHDEPLADRIARCAPSLTVAERRVAETLLRLGPSAAFGTVADVAQAAEAGAATVVRTAGKLGFEGYSALQAAARRQVVGELAPAAQRIHHGVGSIGELIGATLEVETANLRHTFESLDEETIDALADDLADVRHRVVVIAGEAATGVAAQFSRDLGSLRPDVVHLVGNEVAVAAHLAQLSEGDLLVAIDLRRYDRWLVEAVSSGRERGLRRIVLTDSVLSPLAGGAQRCVVVGAAATGPFDSYVGALAVCNLLVAAAARRLRRVAADRLARAEAAWQRANALLDS